MRKSLKIISRVMLCMLTMCLSLTFFWGCAITHKSGYFTYIKRRDGQIGLTGLTKSGQQQEVLVLPQYIKGKKVVSFDDITDSFFGDTQNKWKSEKLKKVFIPFNILSKHNPFEELKNLTKTILIPAKYGGSLAGYFMGGAGIDENSNNISRVYYPYDGNDVWTATSYRPANLSYMWNYEGSENINEGYYWIDDEDYGSTIKFNPPKPKRDGDTFVGWFKEPECINAWNFDTDTLPQEILADFTNEFGITAQVPILQRTILYAKWQGK